MTMSGERFDLRCPETGCDGMLVLKRSKYGPFYGCEYWATTRCPGSHSAHKDSGAPMGTPATARVKKARHQAHRTFDTLWQGPRRIWNRKRCYRWLKRVMGLTKDTAHISMFDEAQCVALIAHVRSLRQSHTRHESHSKAP
jgi:hypothetical protein